MCAIIFDLDNCLAAPAETDPEIFEPAFAAIRAANRGSLTSEALETALKDIWIHSLDYVAKKHGFSDAMFLAAWNVFHTLEVRGPMFGYGDLDVVNDLGQLRFLVTSGFRRLQESKIRALGIAACFDEIVVDAIDEHERLGKLAIFADLLARFGLRPEEALVVGDNPDSELEAGRILGTRTVQVLRPGVLPATNVTRRVHDLRELRDWLFREDRN